MRLVLVKQLLRPRPALVTQCQCQCQSQRHARPLNVAARCGVRLGRGLAPTNRGIITRRLFSSQARPTPPAPPVPPPPPVDPVKKRRFYMAYGFILVTLGYVVVNWKQDGGFNFQMDQIDKPVPEAEADEE